MQTQDIKQLIEEGDSLKIISQSYSELASVKLKRIRQGVESNRYFFNEISDVYALLKLVAIRQKLSQKPKTKKTISILITSNFRFYGNINNNLIRFFMINTSKFNTDRIIIGNTGKNYLTAIHYFHPYTFFPIHSDMPSNSELKNLTFAVEDYEQVIVFYSKMKSVLIQEPTFQDITQNIKSLKYNQGMETIKELNFIFEPEIERMLSFFDKQIKSLLLENAFLESELARTASRLIAMDQAQNNASKYIQENRFILAATQRSVNNIHLLETLACVNTLRRKKV